MQKIEDLLDKGVDLLKKKDFEEAKTVFEKAITLESDNREALKNLGLCYLNLENYEQGADTFLKLVNQDKKDASSYFYLAECEDKIGNYELSEKYYKKVISLRNQYWDAYKNLALVLLKQGKHPNIIALMERAISKNNEDYQFYYFMASSYMALRQYKEAIKGFKDALKLKPDHEYITNNIGTCYLALSNGRMAKKYYMDYYKKHPKSALTLYNLGSLYFAAGNFKKALQYFDDSYMLEPTILTLVAYASCALEAKEYKLASNLYGILVITNPQAIQYKHNLMYCLIECGQYSEALTIGRVLMEEDPKSVTLQKNIVRLYMLIGEWEYAYEIASNLIKRGKVDDEIYYEQGFSVRKLGDLEHAKKLFQKGLKLNPKNAILKKELGLVYLDMNLPEWAEDEISSAMKLDSENPEIIFAYATFLTRVCEYQKADEYYLKLLKHNKNNPDFMTSYGENLLFQNKQEEALKILRKAYVLDTTNSKCAYHLGHIYFQKKKFKLAAEILQDHFKEGADVNLLNLLGLSYMELSDYKKALNIFNEILKDYPRNHILLINIAKCYLKLKDYKKAREKVLSALQIFSDFEDALNLLEEIKSLEA